MSALDDLKAALGDHVSHFTDSDREEIATSMNKLSEGEYVSMHHLKFIIKYLQEENDRLRSNYQHKLMKIANLAVISMEP